MRQFDRKIESAFPPWFDIFAISYLTNLSYKNVQDFLDTLRVASFYIEIDDLGWPGRPSGGDPIHPTQNSKVMIFYNFFDIQTFVYYTAF